jgi:DNA (cytosine-5)-methyltransferase 1
MSILHGMEGKLRYGSVCSGIEAASVAWHPLGWRASFLSEIESFPRAVLKHHYPETPLHGDFTTIQAGEYEPIDLLVGGTPCQSFSVAGLRGGLDDYRGNLALEYLRLADRLRPRWLVWENVPGVLSSAGGRDFGSILGGMVELGYGFAYRVLDAQFFGVAQRRRRVFAIGHLGDWRRAAAVLFERHGLSGHPSPRREAREGIAGDVAHSLRAGGFDASEDGTGRGTPLVAGTLAANGKAAGSATQQDAESGLLIAFDTTQVTSTLNRSVPKPGDPCHPLARGAHAPAICFSSKDHGADAETDLAPTLRAGGHDGSHANAGVPPAIAFNWQGGGTQTTLGYDPDASTAGTLASNQTPAVAFQECVTGVREYADAGTLRAGGPGHDPVGTRLRIGSAVRRLTPVECERLQGFKDHYTLIPWRNGMAPDGPRYKALGNSMAVPVMAWIGRRIAAVEASLSQPQTGEAA